MAGIIGVALARLAEPIIIILALVLGRSITSKSTLAAVAVAAGALNTVFLYLISPTRDAMSWLAEIIACALAALFWFFVVHSLAESRRRRKNEAESEGYE